MQSGKFDLVNNTIDGNTAGAGSLSAGGIFGGTGGSAAITLRSNILAANSANGAAKNCNAAFDSGGGNMEDTAPSQCGLGAGDRLGVNPLLAPLFANGGPTPTQQLLAGSPAINTGTGCAATDQRGVARPQGAACDAGAYELAPPVPVTGGAGAVTTTAATLDGTLANPDVVGGSAMFEFGTSTSYGSQTTAQAIGAREQPGAFGCARRPQARHALPLPAGGHQPGRHERRRRPDLHHADHPEARRLGVRPSKIVAQSGRGPSLTTARKKRRRATGATVSYSDVTDATSTFTVQAPRKGFRAGSRCRAKRPKHGKRRRCTFYKSLGSFKHHDKAGKNSFHFTGRIKRRPLHAGRYRFEAVARKDGLKSAKLHAKFRIVP